MTTRSRLQPGGQKHSTTLNPRLNAGFVYEFDSFRVDPHRRQLLKGDVVLPVKPKAVDTLVALIANRDHVVDKDELMAWLWPDTVVEEANLSQNIFVLRKALGETPDDHRFILTVARRGYQFVGDVREVATDEALPAPTVDDRGAGDARSVAGRWQRWLVAAVVTGAVALGAWLYTQTEPAGTLPVRSLAVLPLRDVSPGPREGHFADGMTEALIADLATLATLRVVSYQSVRSLRDSTAAMHELAATLAVDGLIEGTIAQSNGRVRVTARLVHGPTDRHLWSATYERPAGDVLALQGELAAAVADAVRLTVQPRERSGLESRGRVDPSAYDLYLRARHFTSRRGVDDLSKSIDYYRQAIAIEPSFAPAHGGLAVALALSNAGPEDVEQSARRALALNPDQADALTVMAYNQSLLHRNWREAEREFESVLARHPNFDLAVNWHGSLLSDLGRVDEAVAARRRLVSLDPLGPLPNVALAILLERRGDSEEALRHLTRALDIEPDYADGHGWLGWVLARRGRADDGLRHCEKAVELSRRAPRMVARLAHVLAMTGRLDQARRLESALRQAPSAGVNHSVYLAEISAGLREHDEAFDRLEDAFRMRAPGLMRIQSNPLLMGLRGDRRYGTLVQRLGLPLGT